MFEIPPWFLGMWSTLLTLAAAAMGWLVSRIFKLLDDQRDADSQLHDRITTLKGDAAETYVRRDDYRDRIQEILTVLARIESKLDGKADRGEG